MPPHHPFNPSAAPYPLCSSCRQPSTSHLHIHIYIYVHICMYVCMYLSIYLSIYLYIYIYIHTHTYRQYVYCVCTCVYIYIYIYIYTHTCKDPAEPPWIAPLATPCAVAATAPPRSPRKSAATHYLYGDLTRNSPTVVLDNTLFSFLNTLPEGWNSSFCLKWNSSSFVEIVVGEMTVKSPYELPTRQAVSLRQPRTRRTACWTPIEKTHRPTEGVR